jgi:TolB-like protein
LVVLQCEPARKHRHEAPTEAARPSIVVLPFDALTDELTTSLARLRDTFVIAHNTAMTFQGRPVDVKAIGKHLGVRYVLEGSVQASGDQMRVSLSTPAAALSDHIWDAGCEASSRAPLRRLCASPDDCRLRDI